MTSWRRQLPAFRGRYSGVLCKNGDITNMSVSVRPGLRGQSQPTGVAAGNRRNMAAVFVDETVELPSLVRCAGRLWSRHDRGGLKNRMPCVTRTSIFQIRPLVRAEFGQRYTEYRVNPIPTVRGGADKESPASGGASMSASRGKDQVFIAVRRRFNACFSTWRIRSAETPYRSASSCRVSLLSPSHRALRTSRARASSVSRAE